RRRLRRRPRLRLGRGLVAARSREGNGREQQNGRQANEIGTDRPDHDRVSWFTPPGCLGTASGRPSIARIPAELRSKHHNTTGPPVPSPPDPSRTGPACDKVKPARTFSPDARRADVSAGPSHFAPPRPLAGLAFLEGWGSARAAFAGALAGGFAGALVGGFATSFPFALAFSAF